MILSGNSQRWHTVSIAAAASSALAVWFGTAAAAADVVIDTDAPTAAQGTPAFSTSWVASGSYKVVARDAGTGIGSFRLTSDHTPGWSVAMPDRGCATDLANPCRTTETLSVAVSALAEGPNAITATVSDGFGNRTVQQVGTLRVDHSKPAIRSVTGPLATGGRWFDGSPDLSVAAHDDYSGVWESEVDLSPGVVGRDTFARDASSGWGDAVTGGAWSVRAGDAANFATSGGRGVVTLPPGVAQATRLYPAPLPSSDQDARVGIRLGDTRQTAWLLLRWSDWTAYRVGVHVGDNGNVWVRGDDRRSGTIVLPDTDTHIPFAPGQTLRLRAAVTGQPSRITAKVWTADALEPADWTVGASDGTEGPQHGGGFGVEGRESGTDAGTVSFDDFAVSGTSGFVTTDPRFATTPDGTTCGTDGCPADLTRGFRWDTSAELEGRHQLKVSVMDALFYPATALYSVGVDRSAPDLALSGGLATRRGGGVPYGDSYPLRIDARDGNNASPLTARAGIKSLGITLTDAGGADRANWRDTQPCPGGSCPMSRDWTFDSAYPPGDYTLRVEAADQLAGDYPGHTSARMLPIHVFQDNKPPSIDFSGALHEFRQIEDDPENMDLGASTYALHVSAQDGDSSLPGSGVKTVDLYLDGAQPDPSRMHVEQPCDDGDCPAVVDWDLDARSVSIGEHALKVVATDQKGNTSDSSFKVVRPDDPAPPPRDTVIEDSGPNDPPADDDDPPAAAKSSADKSPDTSPSGAPRPTSSFYVPSASHKLAFDTGCTAGRQNRRGAAILDFGGPQGTGHVKLIGGKVITLDQATNVAAQFGNGYRHCLPENSNSAINVIMGENNSTGASNVTSGSGAALANAVDALANYDKGHSLSDHVGASGGDDIEPGFGDPGPARDWAAGFSGATHHPLYNFGSADGCPPNASASGRRGGQCVGQWKQGDIYFVSYKHNRFPLPEIYLQGQVPQWPAISLFGVKSGQGKMNFPGVVSEHDRAPSEFSPSTAWSKLFQALRRNPKTSQDVLNYSTDFKRDQAWGH